MNQYKFKYYFNGKRKVTAKVSYAGKVFTGKACCHKDDKFDIEVGKKLASMRCAMKIARFKATRSLKKNINAINNFINAQHCLLRTRNNLSSIRKEEDKLEEEYIQFLTSLAN